MLSDIYKYMFQNRIGCVKISVPASCVVWVRATIGSNQRLQHCYLLLLRAALTSKIKDNVSKWSDMSARRLLFL